MRATIMNEGPDAWGRVVYVVLGALGALVPLAFKTGLTRVQAGLLCIGGAAGAYAIAHPLALWLDGYLPGEVTDIEPACAYFSGVLVMRICEEVLRFLNRRAQSIIDKLGR